MMTAIQTRGKKETTWQASPSDYEATARLMERNGFPELAREWWWKAAEARRWQQEMSRVGKPWQAGCPS
jgi:hypothetical protein